MSSIQTLGVRALRQTMLNEASLTAIVGTNILWENADEDETTDDLFVVVTFYSNT